MPYLLFYTMLLLPFFSVLYAVMTYRRFHFEQDIDKNIVTKGKNLSFGFSVCNESAFFFPFIKLNFFPSSGVYNTNYKESIFSLLPNNSEKHSLQLECRYRGRYDIGLKSVEVTDLLGIVSLKRPIPEPQFIIVYPKIVELSSFDLVESYLEVETASNEKNRNRNESVISDVREYRYGDSMRKIHWKLSSKANKLMVKNYEGASEASAMIVLDLKKGSLSDINNIILEDKLIEAALSVVNYCVNKSISAKVTYFDNNVVETPVSSQFELTRLLGVLAEIKFDSEMHIANVMSTLLKDSFAKPNLVIFISYFDRLFYEKICGLSAIGYDIIIVYISPEELTGSVSREAEEIILQLSALGVKTYKINISEDIKSILEKQ